jgi:hypothetical protein
MKVYIADEIANREKIDLLGGPVAVFQSKVNQNILKLEENLNSADAVLIPHDAKAFVDNHEYLHYINALGLKKPVIYSDRGDYPRRPKISNSISLRVALQPGELRRGIIVLPYNVDSLDFLPFREFRDIPRLSFMGLVAKNTLGRKVRTLRTSPLNPTLGNGAATRKKYLSSLRNSSLDIQIVIRNSYGGIKSIEGTHELRRLEFINSVTESDLVVTPRGDTNQSMRFFETLSAGRIPLFPSTKMHLPTLADPFPEKYLIASNFKSRSIERRVYQYWNSLNSETYHVQQMEVRKFFAEHLDFNKYITKLFSMSIHEVLQLGNGARIKG